MVNFSNITRKVIIIELTVPWEERMEKRMRRCTKYQELAERC